MLERADASFVREDARVRGLATLLDEGAFLATLRRLCPSHDIQSADARYVRYKPHTSCLVAYRVRVGETYTAVYARCHADDQIVKVANARLKMEVRGALGAGLHVVPEEGIAIFAYPNDYEIRSLRKLYEGERTPPRMRRMLPSHPHLHSVSPEILRYKPERRFVGKLDDGSGDAAVIRLYPEAQFEDIRQRAWAFKDRDDLRVPRVVGDSKRYSMLAHRWVDGRLLEGVLCGADDSGPVLEHVSGALAALHRQRPRLNAMYSASDYCRGVAAACDAVSAVDAGLGLRAAELRDTVQRAVLDLNWRSQVVHGDFSADQVVVRGDCVTLLDFDRAAYGNPSMDIGSFAAGLIALASGGSVSFERASVMAGEFAGAYWRASGFEDPAGVRVFTAGALLMRAPEPFRHRDRAWPARIAELLEHAERVMQTEAIDV